MSMQLLSLSPAGLNAAGRTQLVCPRNSASCLPSKFHRRAVRSQDAVTILSPAGLNAADRTQLVCPRNSASCLPSKFHTRAVPS